MGHRGWRGRVAPRKKQVTFQFWEARQRHAIIYLDCWSQFLILQGINLISIVNQT